MLDRDNVCDDKKVFIGSVFGLTSSFSAALCWAPRHSAQRHSSERHSAQCIYCDIQSNFYLKQTYFRLILSVLIIYAIRYGGDSPQPISLQTPLVGSQLVHIVDQWVTFIPTPGNTKGEVSLYS
jgi:hypothetical protein